MYVLVNVPTFVSKNIALLHMNTVCNTMINKNALNAIL